MASNEQGTYREIGTNHNRNARALKEDGTNINWADALFNTIDSFGLLITENTRNVADIGANYPYSPERERVFLNGTELKLQYTSNAKFEDVVDSYNLKPAGGDVMRLQTTERFRYVVGYVIEPSWAFDINQTLQGDDKVVLGYGEPDLENDMADADGWFWEFDSTLSDTQVRLATYRLGTQVASKVVDLVKPYTTWQRLDDRINWYNVGVRESRQTYTDDGTQFNKIVGATSVDDGKGPANANFPVTLAVKADATTTGLVLETGSIGVKILGDVEPILRPKESVVVASHSGGGEWEPLFAIRKKPTNKNVFINIIDVQIAEVSNNDDVELLIMSANSDLTDATGFATPIYHSETNSAIEETTSITEFPDSTGTQVASAVDPGGYQLGFAAYFTAGQGNSVRATTARGIRKRSLNEFDYGVFLAKTDTAMDITVNYEVEQQW